MTQQVINIGNEVNDGTGDTLRTGASKINQNFDEVYTALASRGPQQPADWSATTGVTRILNKPTIPAAQVSSDWNATSGVAQILNKPPLFSGDYNALDNKPTIPPAQINSDWSEGNPSSKAFIANKPTIPAAQLQSNWNETNPASKAFIANKPTIPAAQIQSDWAVTQDNRLDFIKNKPVLFSGDYNDLSNLPTLPSPQVQSDWNETNNALKSFIANKPTINTLVPTQTGNPGKFLTTNGSTVSWATVTGTGLTSRATPSVTTSSLVSGASANAVITGFKGYALLGITVTAGAWVTVYNSTTTRSADAGRSITTDPSPNSGIIAEAISTGASASTTYFTPAVIGFSAENSPTTSIPIKVYNNSGSTNAITVTLILLQLEA